MPREIWIDEFRRAVVFDEEHPVILDADLYLPMYPFKPVNELAIRNVKLLYSSIEVPEELKSMVEEAIVVGLETRAGREAIALRLILNREPSDEEVREVYSLFEGILKQLGRNSRDNN